MLEKHESQQVLGRNLKTQYESVRVYMYVLFGRKTSLGKTMELSCLSSRGSIYIRTQQDKINCLTEN